MIANPLFFFKGCDLLYEYIIKNPDFGEEIIAQGAVEDVLNCPNDNGYPYYNGVRYRFLSKVYEMYPETRSKLKEEVDFLRMAMKNAAEVNWNIIYDLCKYVFNW